ncbi:hypothetical protein [Budvicia aquatica]|uniref:Uncharacterized protein n=1 Tax=Budvicia aquatica TaxID=82979 RepID=A0A2C6DLG7_9GAMM|nr:hypothetical protein [Budvicia aquatica]PHI29182.1 hypothetical protein CRN84_07530 [Budvicia aquatica]
MIKNKTLMLILGIVLLLVGGFLQIKSPISSADINLCQREVAVRYGSSNDSTKKMLSDKCESDVGYVALMTSDASSANQAAQVISAANSSSLGSGMLSLFLLGVGLVFTLVGAVAVIAQRRNARKKLSIK